MLKQQINYGFYVSLFGTVLILIWLGVFKFTPTEAAAIKPLVSNHPLTFWMYDVMSIQMVSNLVGVFEIVVAILIIIGIFKPKIGKLAGIGLIVIFMMTLSYLFTTPGIWKVVDGIPVTDFFMLKDIMYLGFGFTLYQFSKIKS